jgi:hypothetical protein
MSLLDRFNLKSKKMALDVTEVVNSIPAELFTTTEDAEMQTDEAQAQLVADLAVANDTIAELTSAVANHEAAATKALAERDEALKALSVFQAEAKQTSRKAALTKVLAEDAVGDMYAATEALDDAAFSLIVSNLATKQQVIEQSFEELGAPEANAQPSNYEDQLKAGVQARLAKRKAK